MAELRNPQFFSKYLNNLPTYNVSDSDGLVQKRQPQVLQHDFTHRSRRLDSKQLHKKPQIRLQKFHLGNSDRAYCEPTAGFIFF